MNNSNLQFVNIQHYLQISTTCRKRINNVFRLTSMCTTHHSHTTYNSHVVISNQHYIHTSRIIFFTLRRHMYFNTLWKCTKSAITIEKKTYKIWMHCVCVTTYFLSLKIKFCFNMKWVLISRTICLSTPCRELRNVVLHW